MIYLDNAATGRPFEEAIKAFVEVNENSYANPNSKHLFGYKASKILEDARKEVLSLLGLSSTHQCIFLSGASEANSMAIKSVALRYQNRGKKILTSNVEHPSVGAAFEQLEKSFGFEAHFLPVNAEGFVSPETLKEAMDKNVTLVSMMQVNNESGAIFPIEQYADILKDYPKALLHVDATQGIGKVKCDYSRCDLISFSAHKFGGLKGCGALIYRKSLEFLPLVSGGQQEFGYRGGTVSVAGAASLTTALRLTLSKQEETYRHVSELCARVEEGLKGIDGVEINSPVGHSPFLCNFSLLHHKASVVVEALSEKGIYVSTVSACSSKGEPISTVILAMGKDKNHASNSIRVSFCADTTSKDVDTFLAELKKTLKEIKTI